MTNSEGLSTTSNKPETTKVGDAHRVQNTQTECLMLCIFSHKNQYTKISIHPSISGNLREANLTDNPICPRSIIKFGISVEIYFVERRRTIDNESQILQLQTCMMYFGEKMRVFERKLVHYFSSGLLSGKNGT